MANFLKNRASPENPKNLSNPKEKIKDIEEDLSPVKKKKTQDKAKVPSEF